jgi:hypothetical protein
MTIKRLKRNSKDEIKAIDIDFETKNGSTNYNVKSNKPIDPFYFSMSDDGSFGVGAHKETSVIVVKPLNGDDSDEGQKTFIFRKNTKALTEIIGDSVMHSDHGNTIIKRFYSPDSSNIFTTYRASFSNDSLYVFKDAIIDSIVTEQLSKLKTDNYYQNDKPVKIISESSTIFSPHVTKNTIYRWRSEKDKPLVVLDGKIVEDALKTLNPENIESMTVLKGKKAVDSYGDKGKNGVIEIKTKTSRSLKNSKLKTAKKSPWSVRTEVSNVTYVDDEDTSKNGMLAYITKYTSDEQLEKHKADLATFDLKVKFSKIKRNKNGELTSIKISVRNDEGDQSSASWKDDDGIPALECGISEGTLVARTSTMN